MNLRPLNDRVLVRRIDEPKFGRLVIPDVAQKESVRGIVIAVGPGKRNKRGERVPCDVEAGDIIRFGPYTDFDEDNLVMIQQDDVRYVECAD